MILISKNISSLTRGKNGLFEKGFRMEKKFACKICIKIILINLIYDNFNKSYKPTTSIFNSTITI